MLNSRFCVRLKNGSKNKFEMKKKMNASLFINASITAVLVEPGRVNCFNALRGIGN